MELFDLGNPLAPFPMLWKLQICASSTLDTGSSAQCPRKYVDNTQKPGVIKTPFERTTNLDTSPCPICVIGEPTHHSSIQNLVQHTHTQPHEMASRQISLQDVIFTL